MLLGKLDTLLAKHALQLQELSMFPLAMYLMSLQTAPPPSAFIFLPEVMCMNCHLLFFYNNLAEPVQLVKNIKHLK